MTKVAGDTPVPFWQLFIRMGGWWTAFPLVVTLILTLISSAEETTARRFAEDGIRTTAQVLDKYITRSTDSDGDTTTTHYFQLAYTANQTRQMEITESVGQSLYNATDVGSEVPLWYLQSAPERVQLSETEHATTSRVLRWIALVFGIATLTLLWFTGRWTVAAVRARRFGARETAVVTELRGTSVSVNNRTMYRLVWRERSGREGSSMMNRYEELAPYDRGQEIVVYQGLKRAYWTGDVGERPGAA